MSEMETKWRGKNKTREQGFPSLANAIIEQAVEDYRDAGRMLRMIKENEKAEDLLTRVNGGDKIAWEIMLKICDGRKNVMELLQICKQKKNASELLVKMYRLESREVAVKLSVERFVRSEWFSVLTNLDPAAFLKRLQKEESEKTVQRMTDESTNPANADAENDAENDDVY